MAKQAAAAAAVYFDGRIREQRPMGPQPFELADHYWQNKPLSISSVDSADTLNLRWKGYQANMSEMLGGLFCLKASKADVHGDVRLVSGADGTVVQAHQVLLAAASDLFKELLLQEEKNNGTCMGQEPVLIFDGLTGQTLEDLMAYIYRGQVDLPSSRLTSFMELGRAMALKGIFHPSQETQSEKPASLDPSFTGLSLLACAALNVSDIPPPFSSETAASTATSFGAPLHWPFTDENERPYGQSPTTAINLSIKPKEERPPNISDSLDVTRSNLQPSTGLKSALFPISPLLNIPDPASFKWRRSPLATLSPRPMTSFISSPIPENCKRDREDTPPPLAIDMTHPVASEMDPVVDDSRLGVNELPATPSPSPSSLNGHGMNAASTICFGESPGPISVHPTGEETGMEFSSRLGVENKKWKSRQPKLCVHCDRFFSNQFNLKQHILNMHTIGGDVRCDKCNKTVKNKWYLRRHQVTHHNAPLKK